MKKYLYLFSIVLMLAFISCSENYIFEEPKEEQDGIPIEVIPRDTIKDDVNIYPD